MTLAYNPPEYNNEASTDRTLVNYYKEVSYGAVNVITLNLPSSLGWASAGRRDAEHQHEQTDDDPYAPLTLLSFGVVCILGLV